MITKIRTYYVPAYANDLAQPEMRMEFQSLTSEFGPGKPSVASSVHPLYLSHLSDWEKYRYTMEGGREFIDKYLEQFSDRESAADFANRKNRSPCTAIAKSSILEVKNSIYSRMRDINREGGDATYVTAVNGKRYGVDRDGRSMDEFIGDCVIEELLSMGRVGIYIDKARGDAITLADQNDKYPYLYVYQTEQIQNWLNNEETNELVRVVLKDYYYEKDKWGFPKTRSERYRVLIKTSDGVRVFFYDSKGKPTGNVLLSLTQIPLVILELSDSLLKDIADYQISLTNMESSDIDYALKANFPFYTEQTRGDASDFMRPASRDDATDGDAGSAAQAATAKEKQVRVGHTKGRTYGPNMERPGFIHPSPAPLKASMDKQQSIKETMKQLLHLSINNLRPTRQASDSKKIDQQGLESGLAAVGSVLQYGENEIAKIWADYQGSKDIATVFYPADYSLKSDEQRIEEAQSLIDMMDKIASITYQKEVAKRVAGILLKGKVEPAILDRVISEIAAAKVVAIDSETIIADLNEGLLTVGLASEARLYPAGEAEKAKKEHAERIARVLTAQKSGGGEGANATTVPDDGDDE